MSNRYLEGNFAPVSEEITALDLEVAGSLPDWLDGRYLRNGPNPTDTDPETYHWFTGHGMVHGVLLRVRLVEDRPAVGQRQSVRVAETADPAQCAEVVVE